MWIATFDRLIKLKSTLFVLPLTLGGAVLAFMSPYVWSPFQWLAIVVGFTCARTAGMAFNGWIDRKIDAKNARTLDRVLPRGEMPIWQVALIAWGSLILFIAIALSLSKTLFIASLFVGLLIALYSYTKRITSLCHFVLGAILGCGPVMAYLAITGSLSPLPLLLGCVTFLALSASDIVYAIQDAQFDRIEGVHSIPAFLGVKRAKQLAKGLHGLSLIFLGILGVKGGLGPLYYLGLGFLIAFLLRFYYRIDRSSHGEYTPLFFRCNVAFSNITFLSILGGLLWRIS